MARISLIAPDFLKNPDDRLCLEAFGHVLIVNQRLQNAIEGLLNDPPECLVIQKDLPDELDKTVIKALKQDLKLSFLPVILIVHRRDIISGIDFDQYPVDELVALDAPPEELLTRIDLSLARAHRISDNNPLTGLPGNTSILKTIQGYLESGTERAIAYVDIDNFKPLNDKYGFSRGDEVIRMVARILVNVVSEEARSEGFVGHVGGDDFVFSVPIDKAEVVCQRIISSFDSLIVLFLDEDDLKRGYFESKDRLGRPQRFPLTSLSIAVVLCRRGRYSHYGQVSMTAAQLKKKVKSIEGSAYLIDRREE